MFRFDDVHCVRRALRINSQDLLAKIREGDTVMVSFEEKDGQTVVSSVEVTGT